MMTSLGQKSVACPLANLRVPRAPARQANRQAAAAVAMWRCCACGKEWKALPHNEKEECCAFAPCVLSFRPAAAVEVAPKQEGGWVLDPEDLCKAISKKLDLQDGSDLRKCDTSSTDSLTTKGSTTEESCSDYDPSQGDEDDESDHPEGPASRGCGSP